MVISKASVVFGSELATTSSSSSEEATPNEATFQHDAREIADYLVTHSEDYPEHPLTSELHIEPPLIPEANRLDCYFVPSHSVLVHSYVAGGGWNQRRLPLWMVGYIAYYAVALASLRAAISGINHDVDRIPRKRSAIEEMEEVVLEVQEVFDFDFAVRPNREFYEVLRERDHLSRDFQVLERKLERAHADILLTVEADRADTVLRASIAGVLVGIVVLGFTVLPTLFGKHASTAKFWFGIAASIAAVWIAGTLTRRLRAARRSDA